MLLLVQPCQILLDFFPLQLPLSEVNAKWYNLMDVTETARKEENKTMKKYLNNGIFLEKKKL